MPATSMSNVFIQPDFTSGVHSIFKVPLSSLNAQKINLKKFPDPLS